ncbi:MAG TPA: hypothetical protein VNF74_06885 [Terriglobales bacterium]|nr:hypothetical protein [Terriglobales bacterium]
MASRSAPETRPDPDLLLLQAEEEERAESRGRLKIFLGYSSRVGKSYRMLDEGRRRALRGQDVVVGAMQEQRSPEVEAVLAQLEVIPMRVENGQAAMDVPAILRRRPQLCLIDGLAYSNPPGARCAERWQEAETLLAAGISVVASLNLQFIAERRAAVAAIIGSARSGPVVPESFVHTADEIEVVDAPPEIMVGAGPGAAARPGCSSAGPAAPRVPLGAHAGLGAQGPKPALRADQGNVRQLTELREIALLLVADVVDQQLERYLRRHGIEPAWGAQERILLCLSDAPALAMIASGRRNADRFHGELLAVHVVLPPGGVPDPAVERNLEAARAAGAAIVPLAGPDFVGTALQLARERGVTQIFVGHPRHPPRWWQRQRWRQSSLDRLIQRAEGADVRIFPVEEADGHAHA